MDNAREREATMALARKLWKQRLAFYITIDTFELGKKAGYEMAIADVLDIKPSEMIELMERMDDE